MRANGGKEDASISEAGPFLMEHQQRLGGSSLIEEHGDSYRLISEKDGDPVTLHPDAWRNLGS